MVGRHCKGGGDRGDPKVEPTGLPFFSYGYNVIYIVDVFGKDFGGFG
jgi:hypothetical protein